MRWPCDLRAGLLLISLFTIALVLWLSFRFSVQPVWLQTLPGIVREVMTLTELAATATLSLIWTGIIVGRLSRRPPPPPELSVAALYELTPAAFERYVAALFRQKGYHVNVRGGSGDHGVDLEVVGAHGKRAIVQCKRYQGKIGEELVRELYGTMVHERVAHAFLVTTTEFTPAARTWAQTKPITLIDGGTLVSIASVLQENMRAAGRSHDFD